MVRILFFLFCTTLAIQSLAQPLRYTETIFEKTDTLKNVEYANADWLNSSVSLLSEYNIHSSESKTESRPLYMDIFTPQNDTVSKRPVILFGHSGGFLIGSRHNNDMVAFCDSFARRGYVTATMDYRLGMGTRISIFPLKIYLTEENATRAFYRALQDSRAAVRFLKNNAENFGIDTTKIYMVGSSAGAFVALHNLYMNESDEIPELALSEPSLGNLDKVGIQGYGSQVDAVVSMWGAIQSPSLIKDETKPVLLIHGENDDVVYFKKGMPLESSIPDYDEISFTVPETYGGFCIDTALINRNVPHKTYFVPNKKHEFYGVDTGEFGEDGPNQYWDTIHWKISDFLFDIFQPEAEFDYEINDITLSCIDKTLNSSSSEWDFGDGNFASGEQVSHTYSEAGIYRVKLATCNKNMACDTLTQSIKVGNLVNIEQQLSSQLKVYPNPVRDKLYFQGLESEFEVQIIDLLGRTQLANKHCFTNSISVSSLQEGMYIIRIKTSEETIIRKIQKIN